MSTESLIASLTMQATVVKRISHRRICAEWLAVLIISLLAVGAIHGLRTDLAKQLSDPLFLIEIAMNTGLLLLAGCAATSYCYPDRAKAPLLTWLLGLVFIGYTGITLFAVYNAVTEQQNMLHQHIHGLECLLCILSFAVIPALWMVWRLQHLASVKPMLAGAAALMMAVAAGCLGVRLVETEMPSETMILWHYIPLLVMSAIGVLIGKYQFKW